MIKLDGFYIKPAFFSSSDGRPFEVTPDISQIELAGAGLVLAFAITWAIARRDRTSWQEAFATLGLAGVAAAVGGRGWALVEWWWSGDDVQWIWDPFAAAGYSSAGAFVGAGLVLLIARQVFGAHDFRNQLDAVAPGAFVALAFTRLGCVFERCDPGRASELFGVHYADGARLHAFGAYIAVPTLVLVAIAVWRCPADGRRAVSIAIGYAVIRFVAEFFREAPSWLNLGHLVAVAVAVAAYGWWKLDASDHRA